MLIIYVGLCLVIQCYSKPIKSNDNKANIYPAKKGNAINSGTVATPARKDELGNGCGCCGCHSCTQEHCCCDHDHHYVHQHVIEHRHHHHHIHHHPEHHVHVDSIRYLGCEGGCGMEGQHGCGCESCHDGHCGCESCHDSDCGCEDCHDGHCSCQDCHTGHCGCGDFHEGDGGCHHEEGCGDIPHGDGGDGNVYGGTHDSHYVFNNDGAFGDTLHGTYGDGNGIECSDCHGGGTVVGESIHGNGDCCIGVGEGGWHCGCGGDHRVGGINSNGIGLSNSYHTMIPTTAN